MSVFRACDQYHHGRYDMFCCWLAKRASLLLLGNTNVIITWTKWNEQVILITCQYTSVHFIFIVIFHPRAFIMQGCGRNFGSGDIRKQISHETSGVERDKRQLVQLLSTHWGKTCCPAKFFFIQHARDQNNWIHYPRAVRNKNRSLFDTLNFIHDVGYNFSFLKDKNENI